MQTLLKSMLRWKKATLFQSIWVLDGNYLFHGEERVGYKQPYLNLNYRTSLCFTGKPCSVQNKIPLIFSVDIYQRSAIFNSPYLKRKTKREARMGIYCNAFN